MKNEIIGNELTLHKLQEYEESFIDYLDVDDKTLNAYKVGINCLMNFLKENNIKQPTRNDIIAFRDMLRENYSSNTTNTYMVAVKSLFKYLEIHNLYRNIAVDIKGAKYDTTPKKEVLSLSQMQTIYNSLTDLKEKALFGLMITTGLRVCEISTALIEDIRVYNNEVVLFVLGKKRDSKCEYVKLSNQVLKDLQDYIGNRTSGYIFTSTSNHNNGGGLTTTSLRRYIKDIFKRLCNQSKNVFPNTNNYNQIFYQNNNNFNQINYNTEYLIFQLKFNLERTGKIDHYIYSLVKGNFLLIIKNQKGSKIFQKYLKTTHCDILHQIFVELKPNLEEIITDFYANYFCKRFFTFLNQKDRIDFLLSIEKSMVKLSSDSIGTYPIQTIIEHVGSKNEKNIIINSLKDNIKELSVDAFGSHVLEKLLTCFEEEYVSFLYNYIIDNFLELAYNNNGICIVKKILTFTHKKY